MSILEHALLMTDEIRRVPLEELQIRLTRFREEMEKNIPAGRWQLLIIKLICTILPVQCRRRTGYPPAGRNFVGAQKL